MKVNRVRTFSLLLAMMILFSIIPLTALAKSDTQETVPFTFTCENATGVTVTVYDENGTVVFSGKNYPVRLAPGNYTFDAAALGFEELKGQPFTVTQTTLPEGSALSTSFSLTPEGEKAPQAKASNPDSTAADSGSTLNQTAGSDSTPGTAEKNTVQAEKVSGGIFDAHYDKYHAFDVFRSPAYPAGTQEDPNLFTVMDFAAPYELTDLSDEDYFFFVSSVTAAVIPEGWTEAQNLNPCAVELHVMTGEESKFLATGVIGAFSAEGFLFVSGERGVWFSNGKGYYPSSTAVSYAPVKNGLLVCDLSLLTGCEVQFTPPAADASTHVHDWKVDAEGATAVYYCAAEGCPHGDNKYTMTLSVPPYVLTGSSVKAEVLKSDADGSKEWPAELEQNLIYYSGSGYARSTTPPTEEGSYTAEVSVGYRQNAQILKADFVITNEIPVPFSQTKTAEGVEVTLSAEAGVFPADAVLSVTKAESSGAAEAALKAARGGDPEPKAAYGVAVQVLDGNGEPLLPAEGKQVTVSVSLSKPADPNLETKLYCLKKDSEGGVSAEARTANGSTEEEMTGSLQYALELVYLPRLYSLEGNESVSLNDIMKTVGLSGTPEKAAVSDPEILYATEKDGEWRLSALRSFTGKEWVDVTVRGRACRIDVKDGDLSEACLNGHTWCEDNGFDPVYCVVCGELKAIAEGGSFDLEFNNDRWIILGDPEADLENYLEWDEMFEDMELTGSWAADLVTVAESQIGYRESYLNYAMNARRDRNGYNRYSAWYGMPYAEWCATFISFCMHYAGIEDRDMPYNSGCVAWVEKLEERDMYVPAEEYSPRTGDLVFYDDTGNGFADHVGIVKAYSAERGVMDTIEGNIQDMVVTREQSSADERILGYGILPENPDFVPELKQRSIEATAGGQRITVEGLLPADATLSVTAVPLETAEEIYSRNGAGSGSRVVYAYDIAILSMGERHGPEEYGKDITITLQDIVPVEDNLEVLHVKVGAAGGSDDEGAPAADTENVTRRSLKTEEADGVLTFSFAEPDADGR